MTDLKTLTDARVAAQAQVDELNRKIFALEQKEREQARQVEQAAAARAGQGVDADAIQALTAEQCERAYSGKQGCMCGCRGEYREGLKPIARVLKRLQADPRTRLRDGILYIEDLERDERNYVVYTKDFFAEQAAKLAAAKAELAAREQDATAV